MKNKIYKYAIAALVFLISFILLRAIFHQPNIEQIRTNNSIILDEVKPIENLSKSIEFKTISHPDYTKFDYEEFQRFLDWLEDEYFLIFKDLESKYLAKSLLLKWEGANKNLNPILLTGHYDVVPAGFNANQTWKENPFDGKVDDKYIWGRGALDDKSGVIAILEAISYLLKNNFSPERTIYFSFGHDEEIGGERGAAKITEYFINENIRLEWTLDEGSFLLENIIPGINKSVAMINVAEKGGLTLKVIGKSLGGHSSMPASKSSVGYLADALVKLEENPMPGKLDGVSLELFNEVSRHMTFKNKVLFANLWLFEPLINSYLSKSPSMNAVLRTTTALTMLSASDRANVLSSEAIGIVNFRLHPRDNVDDVIDHVTKFIGNENIEIHQVGSAKLASNVSSWTDKGYLAISDSVKEIYQDVIVVPGLMVGGSDSKHYAKVAKNSYRFNPFLISSNEISGIHGTNERIKKVDFINGIKTYIRIIENGSDQ